MSIFGQATETRCDGKAPMPQPKRTSEVRTYHHLTAIGEKSTTPPGRYQ
jgi:hypothetical protein